MTIRQWIGIGLAAIVVPYLARQVRKPTRWVGRLFAWTMNRSHSALTEWGLKHVTIGSGFAILDVGCGGGRTVQKLAAVAGEGRVAGVDFAPGSVETARAVNASLISAGRVEIRQASVSELPFPDASFDLVTAIETHYYWPDLPRDVKEVFRVVKPGGTAIVIAEAYRRGSTSFVQAPVMALLGGKLMSAAQHRAWLESAGFTAVEVHEQPHHGWICVTGRKPT